MLLAVLIISTIGLSACGNTDSFERIIKVIFTSNAESTYLTTAENPLGINITVKPTLNLVTNQPIEHIAFKRTNITIEPETSCHNITFNFSENKPKHIREYRGFYIYRFSLDYNLYGCSFCNKDEEFAFGNFVFDIDGETHISPGVYYINVFDGESLIKSDSNANFYGSEGRANFAFKATEDIEITDIYLESTVAELCDSETNANLFGDLPVELKKGEIYNFTADCKIKSYFTQYGSDFFIAEYKKAGEQAIRKAPFGYIGFMPEYDIYERAIDEILYS